jgi:hypothetical protein
MREFKLDNHPKIETGFKTPENYFNTLSTNINQRLHRKEPKVISFYQRNKKVLFAVAATLVLALSIPFFMQQPTKVSDLDHAIIEDYISYNTKITTYELAEFLDKEDIEKLQVDFDIPNDVLEQSIINNQDFERYLIH